MSDKQWVFDNPQEAADLIDQLQARVDGLEHERNALWNLQRNQSETIGKYQNRESELLDERDALAAHVERFNSIMANIHTECDYGGESDDDPIPSVLWDLYRETPQQSLAERDAEVARKAILTTLEQPDYVVARLPDSVWVSSVDIERFANEYAERVKRGEV